MVVLIVIAEVFVALLLVLAGYFYYTGAEDFCQRDLTYSEKVRQPWRSILYPRWFYGTGRCVFQMRITGIGGMVMGAFMFVVAVITFFSGRG
jgi:hypothetical protein